MPDACTPYLQAKTLYHLEALNPKNPKAPIPKNSKTLKP